MPGLSASVEKLLEGERVAVAGVSRDRLHHSWGGTRIPVFSRELRGHPGVSADSVQSL
jgi:hypothetical protein